MYQIRGHEVAYRACDCVSGTDQEVTPQSPLTVCLSLLASAESVPRFLGDEGAHCASRRTFLGHSSALSN